MILLNYYLYSQAHTRYFPRRAKHLQGFLLQGRWHISWKQCLLTLVNLAQYLVYVFTICSHSACRSSMALCNLYYPSSFPKAVYYLLNFKVYSLAPGTLLCFPKTTQAPTSSSELFCHQTCSFACWDSAVCLQFFTINVLNLNTTSSLTG